MKICFFEVQPWEKELLTSAFPDAQYTEEPLTIENAAQYSDTEIISPFIYSRISHEVIDLLPNLKYITTRSTGYDHIDVSYCKTKQIVVSNVPEYGSHTVAEHTFALILTLTRKIHQSINQAKQLNFDHREIKGIDLYGKTIGIIGLGKIGMEVLKIAKGFGMNILVHSKTPDTAIQSQYGCTYADLDTLLASSDIITLHLPDNPQTHHLINKENIMKCKKGSYLINTARGGLIDTEALLMGLQENILAGVGLDVLEEEKELSEEIDILTPSYQKEADLKTLVLDHVLMNHPNVIITPHNAFNSQEALTRILHVTRDNIVQYIHGTTINSCD